MKDGNWKCMLKENVDSFMVFIFNLGDLNFFLVISYKDSLKFRNNIFKLRYLCCAFNLVLVYCLISEDFCVDAHGRWPERNQNIDLCKILKYSLIRQIALSLTGADVYQALINFRETLLPCNLVEFIWTYISV